MLIEITFPQLIFVHSPDHFLWLLSRLTPMASSSWLQSGGLADSLSGEDVRRRDLHHFCNAGVGEFAGEEEGEEGPHFGGLDIIPPATWRDYERRRLAANVFELNDEMCDMETYMTSTDFFLPDRDTAQV